jgi:hypothetical protein
MVQQKNDDDGGDEKDKENIVKYIYVCICVFVYVVQ